MLPCITPSAPATKEGRISAAVAL